MRRLIPNNERNENEKVNENEQTQLSLLEKRKMASGEEVSHCPHSNKALILNSESTRFP